MAEIEAATSIMYGNIEKDGALSVAYFCTPSGILTPEEIAELIRNPPENLDKQVEPFWCSLEGPHRLVYTLLPPNWYFPCLRDMQAGQVPWKLMSNDPRATYGRPQFISERNIWGGDDKRIKTAYVDYSGGNDPLPSIYNLYVNIWNDPSDLNSWKTPIVIDPGGRGGGSATP
ncbi:MAG: hypothetical protein JKY34_00365 [Kordiimonadaceae bacterium]|nr:hypothetical protein [Kordiimonadaceae bacterium]